MKKKSFKLTLKFGKSRSAYYDRAINLARECPGYDEINNSITFDSDTLADNYDTFDTLWRIIRRWRSSEVLLNGKEIGLLSRYDAIPCFLEYHQAIIQDIHCWADNNMIGWGCKLLTAIKQYYVGMGYVSVMYHRDMHWYEIGHFITDDVWQIDKPQIIYLLKREAKIKHINDCPLFDFDRVIAHVNELPDTIDVSENKHWEIYCKHEPGGNPQPAKIVPVNYIDD